MALPERLLLQEAADSDNQQQNHRIFQIYHVYRMVLSLVFWASFYFRSPTSVLGSIDQSLFVQVCSIYTVANLLALLLSPLHGRAGPGVRALLSFGIIIADILLLALLSYTCGGVSSGLAHLMLVPVATGSILFNTRLGIFLASIGSIAAMYAEGYLYFSQPGTEHYYVQAGLLGMLLFVLSLGLQYLGYRIRQKEQINRQQAASIQSLQEINQQIIQRMQTGVVVVDQQGRMLNCNDSARRLLSAADAGTTPAADTLPELLAQQLRLWLAQPDRRSEPFRLSPGAAELQANFSFLQAQHEPHILIFLEDYSQLSSRAQHLKLMSLGRLSASIAHEIRNPLGAISHACQLLGESSQLHTEDQRLLAIINTHSQRVNNIIESVLEHSRPQQQAPELFALAPWLQQFVTRFRNSYAGPVDCELQTSDAALQLRFNPGQLEQLLTNLCDNAIRYSAKVTGQAWVRISTGPGPDGEPLLEVCDAGPGVPPERAEQIFEPFFTTENQGTGLGLFICKEICEANQAQIFHTRSPDGLSCFRIQFAHPDRHIS